MAQPVNRYLLASSNMNSEIVCSVSLPELSQSRHDYGHNSVSPQPDISGEVDFAADSNANPRVLFAGNKQRETQGMGEGASVAMILNECQPEFLAFGVWIELLEKHIG